LAEPWIKLVRGKGSGMKQLEEGTVEEMKEEGVLADWGGGGGICRGNQEEINGKGLQNVI
jgi:hypothetical protein